MTFQIWLKTPVTIFKKNKTNLPTQEQHSVYSCPRQSWQLWQHEQLAISDISQSQALISWHRLTRLAHNISLQQSTIQGAARIVKMHKKNTVFIFVSVIPSDDAHSKILQKKEHHFFQGPWEQERMSLWCPAVYFTKARSLTVSAVS